MNLYKLIILGILAALLLGAAGAQPGGDHQADASSRRRARSGPVQEITTPSPRSRDYLAPTQERTEAVEGVSCQTSWTEQIFETETCFYCPHDDEGLPAELLFCITHPTPAPMYPPPVVSTPQAYPTPDPCSGDISPCEG